MLELSKETKPGGLYVDLDIHKQTYTYILCVSIYAYKDLLQGIGLHDYRDWPVPRPTVSKLETQKRKLQDGDLELMFQVESEGGKRLLFQLKGPDGSDVVLFRLSDD